MRHLDESVLNEYLDEVLGQSPRSAAEAHLGTCPDCRARLEDLKMVFQSLSLIEERPLAHDLTPLIVDRLPVTALPFVWRLALTVWVGLVLGLLGAIGQAVASIVHPVIDMRLLVESWINLINGVSFSVPSIELRPLDLSGYSLPFSSPVTIALLIVVTILWGLGNARLLRNGFEV